MPFELLADPGSGCHACGLRVPPPKHHGPKGPNTLCINCSDKFTRFNLKSRLDMTQSRLSRVLAELEVTKERLRAAGLESYPPLPTSPNLDLDFVPGLSA